MVGGSSASILHYDMEFPTFVTIYNLEITIFPYYACHFLGGNSILTICIFLGNGKAILEFALILSLDFS